MCKEEWNETASARGIVPIEQDEILKADEDAMTYESRENEEEGTIEMDDIHIVRI
jgi:hypothetical protein